MEIYFQTPNFIHALFHIVITAVQPVQGPDAPAARQDPLPLSEPSSLSDPCSLGPADPSHILFAVVLVAAPDVGDTAPASGSAPGSAAASAGSQPHIWDRGAERLGRHMIVLRSVSYTVGGRLAGFDFGG